MDSLQNLINALDSITWNSNVELEFRVQYDFKNSQSGIDTLEKIIQDIKGVKTIEKTINCIQNSKEPYKNNIYQIVLNNTTIGSNKKTYYKKRLIKPVFGKVNNVSYKMSIAEEKDIKNFRADYCNMMRIKNRLSITNIKEIKNWRMDITLIKSIKNIQHFNLDELDEYISKMFPKEMNNTNFENYAPFNYADSIEMELEYINNKKPTMEDLKQGITIISKLPLTDDSPHNILEGYNSLLVRIARWIKPKFLNKFISGKWGLKKLLPHVISLDIYRLYDKLIPNMKYFYISPKLDGIRTILLFDNEKEKYFSINNNVKELTLLDFGCEKQGGLEKNITDETILDTELYNQKYYIFDIISYRGNPVYKLAYKERLMYIDKVLDEFAGCENLIKKPVYSLSDPKKLQEVLKMKFNFETDGFVFTPGISTDHLEADYLNSVTYKWKPLNMLSIDFLIKDKILYCGIQKDIAEKIMPYKESIADDYRRYIPVRFSPTYIPLNQISNAECVSILTKKSLQEDDIIAELIWDKKEWKILKIRHDRQIEVARGNYFGNDHKVADLIWHSIFWYISEDNLLGRHLEPNYMLQDISTKDIPILNRIYMLLMGSNYTHLVDMGICFPFLTNIVKGGIKNMCFVISDGFNCLKLINEKYSKYFVNSPEKHIIINAYKPIDYEHFGDVCHNKKIYIGILPTNDQIKIIKKLVNKNKCQFKIMVHEKNKNILGSKKNISQLNILFPQQTSLLDKKMQDLYLISNSN